MEVRVNGEKVTYLITWPDDIIQRMQDFYGYDAEIHFLINPKQAI